MAYQLPILPGIDPATKLPALVAELHDRGFVYGYGVKIIPLSLQGDDVIGTDAAGNKHDSVDCSGFVAWALYHLTGGAVSEQIGSQEFPEWAEDKGAEMVTPSTLHDTGNTLYMAILPATVTADHIGHIMLVCAGNTFESHGGGVGPSSRVWGSESFMGQCHCYRLWEQAA